MRDGSGKDCEGEISHNTKKGKRKKEKVGKGRFISVVLRYSIVVIKRKTVGLLTLMLRVLLHYQNFHGTHTLVC